MINSPQPNFIQRLLMKLDTKRISHAAVAAFIAGLGVFMFPSNVATLFLQLHLTVLANNPLFVGAVALAVSSFLNRYSSPPEIPDNPQGGHA
jgi:hypothetical protein